MKRTNEKLKSNRGITLVALVVTIIVLIILATISVNIVMNGGLINRSEASKELHEMQNEKERLELIKGEVASDISHVGKVTVDTYIEELIKQGITVEEDVTDNRDGSKTVITDTGYSVTIEPRGENDIEIIIDGKAGQLPPRIKSVKLEKEDTNKIKITIEAIRGNEYKYEYKIDDGNETSGWITIEEGTNSTTVTTPELDEEEKYIVRVTVTNENGNVSKTEKIALGEDTSGANTPKLSEGMTPVKWNGVNWEKTTESDQSWYNYSETKKKWANVVLGDSIFKEVNGKEVLDEDADYSMLVWIPRYAYQIKSMYHQSGEGTIAGEIDIVFIDTNNTSKDGTKYTRDSAEQYPEATVGGSMADYVVHPAFDFGGTKLPGFWVGKFESSFVGTGTTDASGQYNETDKIMMIKANVTSWRGINTSNMYDVCLEMNKAGNVYNLPTNDNIVDPHMIKNDEWGAVAYLSKSRYGKETEEVYINNNSNYITGIAGNTASVGSSTATANKYNTTAGQKASTNGNITGVYDMSGGAYEHTAAYVANDNDYLANGASLVNGEARYKNVYTSNGDTREGNYSVSTPTNGHYGDAVYETSDTGSGSNSWYADYSDFICSTHPFFIRGGRYPNTTSTGMFSYDDSTGGVYSNDGFRVVVPIL